MELELKHLSAYPIGEKGLEVIFENSWYKVWGIQNTDCQPKEEIPHEVMLYNDHHGHTEALLMDIKPIFHPLSDLTNEMPVNGKMIIPLHQIQHENRVAISDMINQEHGPPRYEIDTRFKTYSNHIGGNFHDIYKTLEWLFALHFDLFNLIPEDLAIDINTLK